MKYISITNFCYSDGTEPPKQLEIPTLGHQPVVLGGFFSAVEDEFVAGLALFSREDIR